MSNFIITGLPRSGTKFLAHTLNNSKSFNVIHDINYGDNLKIFYNLFNTKQIKKCKNFVENRFINKNNRGEISGAFRHIFFELDFVKRGVILRHPEKMVVSIANMQNIPNAINYINNMDGEIKLLDKMCSIEGVDVFKFHEFTKDKKKLIEISKLYGINDIDFSKIDINKKINSRSNVYTIDDFPKNKVDQLRKTIDWFVEKYNLEYV